jgi:hypothetical protein
LGFGALIMVTHAQAEAQLPQCGPRGAVLAQLADQFGEN